MRFAEAYIQKHQVYPFQIQPNISDVQFCIVIPVINEPNVLDTLHALWDCERPHSVFAVLICINSNEKSSSRIKAQNDKTEKELAAWIKDHQDPQLQFYVTHYKDIQYKFRGAGMARKLGMDEAVNLFRKADNPNGVIISLDADVNLQRNYLVEIEKYYQNHPKARGATIYFEHPVEGTSFPENIYNAIINYELYLRYFNMAMRYTGYPYASHSVGSCFSVKAKTYISQGGMNRHHAGEDFYFLQKIIPLGDFGEINTTTVIPSPRISDRVPFGTGPEVKKMLDAKTNDYPVYQFQAFEDLRITIAFFPELYKAHNEKDIETIYFQLPEFVAIFISKEEFVSIVVECQQNTSNKTNFLKRFIKWFNAFKMIKYLNWSHDNGCYQKEDVLFSVYHLLKAINSAVKLDSKKEVLLALRNIEKTGFYPPTLLPQ